MVALAQDCGLSDAIFTGRVPHEDVQAYYSLIDLFVVPRRPVSVCHLVTPLKPFEALACGRTLVLSDVDALREIARDSGSAALFTAGDPESLATVLRELIDDPQERARLAASGADWVRGARTWDGNADSYLAVYEALGAVPPGARAIESASPSVPDTATLARWIDEHGPVGLPTSIDPVVGDAEQTITEGDRKSVV